MKEGHQMADNRGRKAFLLCSLLAAPLLLAAQTVSDYARFTAVATSRRDHRTSIVLRRFRLDRQTHYLLLDPDSLKTTIESGIALRVSQEPWDRIKKRFATSLYFRAMEDAGSNAGTFQNAGITHFSQTITGVVLTVDLCPSKRPMDRDVFTELIREFGKEERPVPLAVAVTGVWMERHGPDLEWLRGLEKSSDVSITWIDHSYNHRWDKNLPLKENFLLEKGTDLADEVLRTEAKMIEKGLLPSVFFRFPGLVSDNGHVLAVMAYGLIPVGSDAWLGKNEQPKEGSIVLVHANGNEPIGIRRFLKLIREERENIIHKQWLLFDLRESTVLEEKKRAPKKNFPAT
jgi:hypothetical protein